MTDKASSTTQVLQGNAVFANNLYQILARKPGNVFFSPFSVHAILSMIYQGARDETAKALADTLGLPDAECTATAYRSIMDRIKTVEDVVLLVAYKIYAGQYESFKVEFEKEVRDKFDSEIEFLDFDDRSGAVKIINEWVEKKTDDKIKGIIAESFITEETGLILINAIYFKGGWREPFREDSTQSTPFYLDGGSTVDVQMMHGIKSALYKHDEDLNAYVLALPFKGDKINLVIILPEEKDGIKNLEMKLSTSFGRVTQNLGSKNVSLSLPKFKLEADMDLNKILLEMGLKIIFDKRCANFKGIIELASNENLSVDSVIQKAFIEVNEWGTEAAAATVVKKKIMKRCMKLVDFNVDHPAIFMLVDGQGDAANVLFYGRLSHPK